MGDVEQFRGPTVKARRGGDLTGRVIALEVRMLAAEGKLEQIHENTSEILTVVKGAKTIGGFARKYGPRAITFGAGAFTVLGIGNVKFWDYVTRFFMSH